MFRPTRAGCVWSAAAAISLPFLGRNDPQASNLPCFLALHRACCITHHQVAPEHVAAEARAVPASGLDVDTLFKSMLAAGGGGIAGVRLDGDAGNTSSDATDYAEMFRHARSACWAVACALQNVLWQGESPGSPAGHFEARALAAPCALQRARAAADSLPAAGTTPTGVAQSSFRSCRWGRRRGRSAGARAGGGRWLDCAPRGMRDLVQTAAAGSRLRLSGSAKNPNPPLTLTHKHSFE